MLYLQTICCLHILITFCANIGYVTSPMGKAKLYHNMSPVKRLFVRFGNIFDIFLQSTIIEYGTVKIIFIYANPNVGFINRVILY